MFLFYIHWMLSNINRTYPSTHGVFEDKIVEVCNLIHENGGLVYMDGANMNAHVIIGVGGVSNVDTDHLFLQEILMEYDLSIKYLIPSVILSLFSRILKKTWEDMLYGRLLIIENLSSKSFSKLIFRTSPLNKFKPL